MFLKKNFQKLQALFTDKFIFYFEFQRNLFYFILIFLLFLTFSTGNQF